MYNLPPWHILEKVIIYSKRIKCDWTIVTVGWSRGHADSMQPLFPLRMLIEVDGSKAGMPYM